MVIEPHMKQGRQHKLISTIFLATSVTKKLDHNNPNGFAYIEQTPVSPLKIGWYISSALKNSAAIIFMVVCACAGVQVVIDTGALETAIRNMIDKFKNKEVILILVTLFTLGTLGFVQNAVSMAGLVPVMILSLSTCLRL